MSNFDQPSSRREKAQFNETDKGASKVELDNHRAGVLIRKLAGDNLPKNPKELEGMATFMLGELDRIKEAHPDLYGAADDMVTAERGMVEKYGQGPTEKAMGEVNHAYTQALRRHETEAKVSGGNFNIEAAGVYAEALQEVALRPGSMDTSTELFGSLFAHRLAEIRLEKASPAYLKELRARER